MVVERILREIVKPSKFATSVISRLRAVPTTQLSWFKSNLYDISRQNLFFLEVVQFCGVSKPAKSDTYPDTMGYNTVGFWKAIASKKRP